MSPTLRHYFFGLLCVASLAISGCAPSQTPAPDATAEHDDHEGHDHEGHDHEAESHSGEHAHADSFAGVLSELDELTLAIKTAFANDDFETADGPVHEIGHLLESLPKLAAKDQIAESDREKVTKAVDSLMDCFGALDERLHGGEEVGKSFDEIANEVSESLQALKSIQLPEAQQ